jgi:quinoprotein glucose dehydrogenase
VSDWVNGWNLPGKGRIYKITNPEGMKDPHVAEAKKLIAEGFDNKSVDELVKLLGHPHREVRMEAQFALAGKGKEAIPPLMAVSTDPKAARLARLHAVWGLEMVVRHWNDRGSVDQDLINALIRAEVLLKDSDSEIRAAGAHLFGDSKILPPGFDLANLFRDPEPRVRLAAILAHARTQAEFPPAFGTRAPKLSIREAQDRLRNRLCDVLRGDGGKDPALRHAVSLVLASRVRTQSLVDASGDESSAVRTALVVALRRKKAPEVGAFLADGDPKVVAEAARAISDEILTPALPKLAEFTTRPNVPPVIVFRALNARFLLGRAEDATDLANFAARADVPDVQRALALRMLGDWASPPRRDYITGLTQKIASRPANVAVEALTGVLGKVFAAPDAVRKEATGVAAKLGIKQVGPFLVGIVTDAKAPAGSRVEALRALEALKDPKLSDATATALASAEPRLRTAARAVAIKKDPSGVMKQLRDVLANGPIPEQQGAFAILAANPSADADALVGEWLGRLSAGTARVGPGHSGGRRGQQVGRGEEEARRLRERPAEGRPGQVPRGPGRRRRRERARDPAHQGGGRVPAVPQARRPGRRSWPAAQRRRQADPRVPAGIDRPTEQGHRQGVRVGPDPDARRQDGQRRLEV